VNSHALKKSAVISEIRGTDSYAPKRMKSGDMPVGSTASFQAVSAPEGGENDIQPGDC